ncbi:MAG TPA: VWA domain-containing protein [Pyrinomonadaceae bacterium]
MTKHSIARIDTADATHRLTLRVSLTVIILLFASIPCSAQSEQDDDVVRVESDLVVLNVTVTDKQGKYVRRLPLKEFKVFEDGIEQKISTFALEENPFAAAILIDTSGSMEGRISLARAAAIRFLDRLRPDDVVTIFNFDSKVEQVQDFSNSRDLPSLAYDLRAEGQTKLHDAVVHASQALSKRPETRRAILVLSDGIDTKSSASLDKALNAALAANVTIYTVNMTDPGLPSTQRQVLAGALKKLSEKSGGRYVASPGGRSLAEALEDIISELSNQYTLGYRPKNRARDGRWRAIEITLTRQDLNSRTRAGYRAPKS